MKDARLALSEVFDRLKEILEPYGRRMHVTANGPDGYGVDMASEAERDPTTWFGGVRLGKAYVSYYLMPVYVEPSLLEGISSDLRRRMQGKSCFNFTRIDEALLAELAELTRAGYERTAGDPAWGVAQRERHGMAHRRAMREPRREADPRLIAPRGAVRPATARVKESSGRAGS